MPRLPEIPLALCTLEREGRKAVSAAVEPYVTEKFCVKWFASFFFFNSKVICGTQIA